MRTRLMLQEFLSGRPLYIDPSDVALSTIVSMAPTTEATGLPGVQFTLTSTGLPVYVRGTLDVVFAEIVASLAGAVDSAQYAPTITCNGGGTVTAQGGWRALRIGQLVMVSGEFDFAPASNLVPEVVTFSLPTTMQPAAVFADTLQAAGVAHQGGVKAATEAAGFIQSTAAATTVNVEMTQVTGTKRTGVQFSYRVS